MSEVKHDGCFDCSSMEHPELKSVTAARTNPKGKAETKSIALCPPCYDKEMSNRKGVK
ncbi:MAG: hypothetical protein ACYDG4_10835 [Desulfuromonadaceae bacterium]